MPRKAKHNCHSAAGGTNNRKLLLKTELQTDSPAVHVAHLHQHCHKLDTTCVLSPGRGRWVGEGGRGGKGVGRWGIRQGNVHKSKLVMATVIA